MLVFAMAVLPMTDGRAMHLMRAEVPGPTVGKISSKLQDSAKILYEIYFVLTVVEVIILCLGGMPLYDALIHSFGTAGTGGFSNKALSVGAYNNPFFEIVIGIFMLLFGINFNLYYFILLRHFRDVFPLRGAARLPGHCGLCDHYHHHQHRQPVRQCGYGAADGVLPGGFRHNHYRVCHDGFQSLAQLCPHRAGTPDFCRCLCGVHCRRPQGVADHHLF